MNTHTKHDKEYYNKIVNAIEQLLDEEDYTLDEILYGISIVCENKSFYESKGTTNWKYNACVIRGTTGQLKECI